MKIIVTPDASGVVSDRQGRIIGQVLPPEALVVEIEGESLQLDVYQAAIVHEGALTVVSDYRGTGPWYDQKASLAERETPHKIVALGITPPNDEGRPVAPGWENMAMQPRPLTQAEKDAQSKAEAEAKAAAEAARIANLEVPRYAALVALLGVGIKESDIEAKLALISDEIEREKTRLYFNRPTWQRSSAFIAWGMAQFDLTSEQADTLFVAASAL